MFNFHTLSFQVSSGITLIFDNFEIEINCPNANIIQLKRRFGVKINAPPPQQQPSGVSDKNN